MIESMKKSEVERIPDKAPFNSDTPIDLADMPPGVRVTLTAERNLPPETVKALCDMIQIAAKSFQQNETMKRPAMLEKCSNDWCPNHRHSHMAYCLRCASLENAENEGGEE
jgi:hypothetical protein